MNETGKISYIELPARNIEAKEPLNNSHRTYL